MKTKLCLLGSLTAAGWLAVCLIDRPSASQGVKAAVEKGDSAPAPAERFRLATRGKDTPSGVDRLIVAISGQNDAEVLARLEELCRSLEKSAAVREQWRQALRSHPQLQENFVRLALLLADHPQSAAASDILAEVVRQRINGETAPAERLTALACLGHLRFINEGTLAEVSQLARSDGDEAVRFGAIGTMALWLNEPGAWKERIERNLGTLAESASDRELQADALRILIAHSTDLPDRLREQINGFLGENPDREDRLMIGLTVAAFTQEPDALNFALTHLEEACRQSAEVEQKRYILSQMVRLGGAAALELARRWPAEDALLARDVKDYEEIFAQGTTETAEVERQKEERNRERGTPLFAREEEPPH